MSPRALVTSGPVAITSGDPAGIGPDLICSLVGESWSRPLVVLADRQVIAERAKALGRPVQLPEWQPGEPLPAQGAVLWHCDAGATVRMGQADPASAPGTLRMLERAADGCLDGTFAAMVTAPLAKSIICEGADPSFTGHTEFLAQRAGVDQVVMMLATNQLRVALATTHLPLSAVPAAITDPGLSRTLAILREDLQRKFAIDQPRILVLGLNPHAGENGHLGREELDVIIPTLMRLRGEGFSLTGPVPADTAFQPSLLAEHDAVLAMYHDQGLPVLKYAGFGEAVNLTLGLPFIRTSVDHGTAFELAGSGQARAGSLLTATRLAITLADKRESIPHE